LTAEHDLVTRASTEVDQLLKRLAADNGLVVIDLSSVTFIDSSFIACVLVADRQATENGNDVRIYVRDNSNVANVLKISGLAERLRIDTTHAEAFA
jgi:anti-anti-sigma factor